MSTLYIAEFSKLYSNPNGVAPMAAVPPLVQQTLAIGGSSVSSNAFNAATQFVRVHTDAACSINWGAAATSATMRMAANQTEYFSVSAGQTVSVITNS